MGRRHARLGPSGADAWMTCEYFPTAVAEYGSPPTIWSAEGDVGHKIHEEHYLIGTRPEDYVGKTYRVDGFKVTVEADWPRYFWPGFRRIEDFKGELYVEIKVDLDRWMPGQWGFLDLGIAGRRLVVVKEFKFGAGVPVNAVKNRQLSLYALGFWENIARHITDAEEFLLIVDQPRCPGGGGEWRTTLDDLLDFGEEARKAAKRTYRKNPKRVASEKGCRFCPAAKAGECDAFDAFNLKLMSLKFDDLTDSDFDLPEKMTPKRRAHILKHRSQINRWLDSLHQQALDDAIAGRPTPGQKAVYGNYPARKWKDEERASQMLSKELERGEVFTKTLISPAQAEKLLDERTFQKFGKVINKGQPKPVLVPDDDNRPAIRSYVDLFEDLT